MSEVSTGQQKTFFSASIQSAISESITAWYGNCSTQDQNSLHIVIQYAECITRTAMPSRHLPGGAGPEQPGLWRTFTIPTMNCLWSCLLASGYVMSWPGLSIWGEASSLLIRTLFETFGYFLKVRTFWPVLTLGTSPFNWKWSCRQWLVGLWPNVRSGTFCLTNQTCFISLLLQAISGSGEEMSHLLPGTAGR